MQNWLDVKQLIHFIAKEKWPLNSSELNPLDCHVWRNVRGLITCILQTEDYCQTQGATAANLR